MRVIILILNERIALDPNMEHFSGKRLQEEFTIRAKCNTLDRVLKLIIANNVVLTNL